MNRSELIGRLARLSRHRRAGRRSPLGFAMPAMLLAIAACPAAIAVPDGDSPGQADAKKPATKIYKYLRSGTTSFSDMPPSKGSYVVYRPSCYACNLTSNIDWHSTQLHPDKYGEEINHAAHQFGLDPALVRAVIHAESGFDARARSPKGAMGLMQLMPGTARRLGVTDAYIPGRNIWGGARYLADLLAQFKNNVSLAAAAYNAGPEAVQKYAGVPPYAETQVYVQRVKILHQRYRNNPRG